MSGDEPELVVSGTQRTVSAHPIDRNTHSYDSNWPSDGPMHRVHGVSTTVPLSDRHRRLGNAIRQRRLAKDWTLEDLAFATGVSYSYVGQIERGLRNVSIALIWGLADALEVRADELLADT